MQIPIIKVASKTKHIEVKVSATWNEYLQS